ncbi:Glycine/D-amino acid oxidase [Tistlia consotensis]|uniref:Glycine/D-amino acid oxidase n=1 Tax=Tistlia consotensis USBA 355 TaxID=560819 RepID=A0A1Y6CNS3_9PROT|nr:FAD-binding oxidoreductase [Tistlia consotensis]SMF79560.1 Glycine/D-amino acid oxidase [Tistlia consotensis USBA 355]SNS16973.1 Glycine/D-amino acid oxidase [Tistlia consotensis]
MGPITARSPLQFRDRLPEAADVVVIGGGVAGVATAWHLARQGVRVVLCEKGRIAGEQSSRNWGWVRRLGRDPAEMPLMMEANRIWQGLAEATGEDLGFRAEGVVYLHETEAEEAAHQSVVDTAREHQLEIRLLGPREIDSLIDGRPGRWRSAIHCPGDGRAEPWQAVPALARAAQREGAAIAEDCAVRALDLAAGRVAGVVTERGRIRAERVLLAGGAWSSLFLRNHDLSLPQLAMRATVARTAPGPAVFGGGAVDGRLAFRRRLDGGYSLALGDRHDHFIGPDSFRFLRPFRQTIRESWRETRLRPAAPRGYPDAWGTPRRWQPDEASPFERMRVLDPLPSPGAADLMRRRLAERLPALAGLALTDVWAGMIDTLPDVVPVLDSLADLPGLHVATGFSGHGFGIGPAAGRVMADLLQGRPAGHDLSRFRFARFSDGTPIRPGPAL